MKRFTYFFIITLFIVACKDDCEQPTACSLQPEAGLCQAAFVKYFYNQQTQKCEQFTWGGCDGVVPFNTLEECQVCLCNN